MAREKQGRQISDAKLKNELRSNNVIQESDEKLKIIKMVLNKCLRSK
jgi:hypothetical protein